MDRIIAAKVFTEIIERGSMVAAATALDMSRSMVTRYLNEMETWAGVRLLHRSTRRLRLTAAGEQALIQCRQLLEVAGEIPACAKTTNNEPSGLLRISCPQSLAQDILAPFIQRYLQRYAHVSIDLQVSNQAVNLVEQGIDMAIRITNDLDPNLIARPLGSYTSVVCAAPSYIDQYGKPYHIINLDSHNCLTYAHFGKSLWQFQYQGEPTSVAVSGNFSTNEPMMLVQATLVGGGIGFLPKHIVIPYLANGRLTALFTDYEPQPLDIYAIYRSRKHMTPAMRILLDNLVNYLATIDL